LGWALFLLALSRKTLEKERPMNTKDQDPQREEVENPMQERPSVVGNEIDVLAAEEILAARRREAQEETGRTSTILFVP
jgi:hypothetical protein